MLLVMKEGHCIQTAMVQLPSLLLAAGLLRECITSQCVITVLHHHVELFVLLSTTGVQPEGLKMTAAASAATMLDGTLAAPQSEGVLPPIMMSGCHHMPSLL